VPSIEPDGMLKGWKMKERMTPAISKRVDDGFSPPPARIPAFLAGLPAAPRGRDARGGLIQVFRSHIGWPFSFVFRTFVPRKRSGLTCVKSGAGTIYIVFMNSLCSAGASATAVIITIACAKG